MNKSSVGIIEFGLAVKTVTEVYKVTAYHPICFLPLTSAVIKTTWSDGKPTEYKFEWAECCPSWVELSHVEQRSLVEDILNQFKQENR